MLQIRYETLNITDYTLNFNHWCLPGRISGTEEAYPKIIKCIIHILKYSYFKGIFSINYVLCSKNEG